MESWNDRFFILTNMDNAYNFKVIEVDSKDPTDKNLWNELVPHDPQIMIDAMQVFSMIMQFYCIIG
jgi:oligopeptidase B